MYTDFESYFQWVFWNHARKLRTWYLELMIPYGCRTLTDSQQEEACKMLSVNTPQVEVAKHFGTTQPTISRMASRVDRKKLIEEEAQKMIAELPDVMGEMKRDFKTSGQLSKYLAGETTENSSKLESISDILSFRRDVYKKQHNILQMVGLYPSQSPSIVVNQMFNDNRTQVLSPGVADVIGKHLVADAEGEVVSSEVVEDED